MKPLDEIAPTPYYAARRFLRDADVLLFRPTSLAGRLIAAGTGPYSHAAMAAWWRNRVMCLDTIQWRGGGAAHLSELVRDYPGVIDVFRPRRRLAFESVAVDPRRWLRSRAVARMVAQIGRRYGWLALAKAALINARLTRRFWRSFFDAQNDGAEAGLPHCAMAVSLALQRGLGIDPCPGLAPWATSPSDLARSKNLDYLFTLMPNS